MHIKSSLHWTLGHVAQLIAGNDGYTMAGVSEISYEKWIESYRYITVHTVNPGSEMVGAIYISNFDIFVVKLTDNQDAIKKFDILHCPFEKNAIEVFQFFLREIQKIRPCLSGNFRRFNHVYLATLNSNPNHGFSSFVLHCVTR